MTRCARSRGPSAMKVAGSSCMPICRLRREPSSRPRSTGWPRRCRRCRDEQGGFHLPARRADALVGLCSARLAADPDLDRATVVIHARAERAIRRPAPRSKAAASHNPRRSNGSSAPPASRPSTRRARAGDRHGTDHPRAPALAPAAGPLPRRWLPLPRVRHEGLHPGAPHRVLARGRRHRPRQPRHPVLVAPQVGPRVRVVDQGKRTGRPALVSNRRRALRGGSGIGTRPPALTEQRDTRSPQQPSTAAGRRAPCRRSGSPGST